MKKFVTRVCCVLLLNLFGASIYAETSVSGVKLVSLSIVCDPPRLYIRAPLVLDENSKVDQTNSRINAFALDATRDLGDDKNIDGGAIKGSFTEELVPINFKQNKILFSSTSVNVLHAIELEKKDAVLKAKLYLIDKTELETVCYQTSEGYFD